MTSLNPKSALAAVTLILVLSIPVVTAGASTEGPGLSSLRFVEDLNGDGRVDVLDVLTLILRGRDDPSAEGLDFSGDGVFSLRDVVSLVRRITGNSLNEAAPTEYSWRVIGPGGGGGQFLPTVSPADPTHVFVRCDMTGAYVTYDGGSGWRMFNLRNVITDFQFDPSSPGTVYAASSGLFRSDDRGMRWSLVYPSPADIIREHMAGDHADHWIETAQGQPEGEQAGGVELVRVDPSDSRRLWLAHSAPWGSSYYVLVSNDRGASWRRVAEGLESRPLGLFPGAWWDRPDQLLIVTGSEAITVSDTSRVQIGLPLPGTAVAADGGRGEDGALVYILAGNKVYLSEDRGSSWRDVSSPLFSGGTFNTLAVCETRPEVVYLSCGEYPNWQFGIFKTADKGAQWEWVYRADGNGVLTNNLVDKGWLDNQYGPSWRGSALSIGVGPRDPDICYVTDYGGTMRTLDGGRTWNQVYSETHADGSYTSRGLDVTGSYTLKFNPFDSLHIFAPTTDIGAFQSFDGGLTWQTGTRGVPSNWRNTCYWMEFDPEVPGRAWSAWSNKHDLPRDKMFRYGYSNPLGGVMVSSDGGRNWTGSSVGLPVDFVATHLVIDPRSPSTLRTLYASGFRVGVYKSSNGGLSWQATAAIPGANKNVWRLAVLPDGRLFALVARDWPDNRTNVPGGLYVSDNDGASWSQVSLPGGVNFPNDLIYDPAEPNRLYLSCWPWMEVGPMVKGNWQVTNRGGGLLMSEDRGNTWRRIFREDAHVYGAAVDPANSATIVINTFDSAAFRSDDRGESWSRIRGYNFKWGYRPIFDPRRPGMIYLTTFGGGIHHGPAAGDPAAFEDIDNFQLRWRWGEEF